MSLPATLPTWTCALDDPKYLQAARELVRLRPRRRMVICAIDHQDARWMADDLELPWNKVLWLRTAWEVRGLVPSFDVAVTQRFAQSARDRDREWLWAELRHRAEHWNVADLPAWPAPNALYTVGVT